MTHVAFPHIVAEYGVAAGLLGLACAMYLQVILERAVPARYPAALALTGAGLVLTHAEVVAALPPATLIRLRLLVILVATVLFLAGTAWVLVNVEDVAEEQPEETLPADDLDVILEHIVQEVRRRVR